MAAQKLKVLIVELSSCVALTPRRETHGDEWAMNLRGKHLREAYSPKCLEDAFYEVGGLSLLSDYGDRAMSVPDHRIRDTAQQSPL
jgi:hypothetical protein